MRLPFLQDMVHRLELGGGIRFVRAGLSALALVVIIGGYNWRAFRNMSTQEAMDMAQVGRNLSEGKGYSTLFIRPLSIYLVKKTNREKATPGTANDRALLKRMHPDLANPPVYPTLLAGAMKVLPFHYKLPATPRPSFWTTSKGAFYRSEPDFIIALVNQALFLLLIVLLFFLARRLFDHSVAWLSAILVLATELFWHFTVSGLSTILLMLIFVGLLWSLTLLEEQARAPKWNFGAVLLLAALTGACVGVGGMTRYAFGWLILPVLAFLAIFGGPRRVLLVLVALLIFAGVMAPWILRNLGLSGTPFGTATYTVLEDTFLSPNSKLLRSLDPDLTRISLLPFWIKLMTNLRAIVENDLPKLGGSWVSAFFFAGLLIGFRNPATRRIRYFLLFCLPFLILAQALGRTQLSEDSPMINSENLLVLVAPIVLMYGVGLFFLLLDQISLPLSELRYMVIGLFGIVASLPMILIFLPPRTSAVTSPYDPPRIQLLADWLNPSELCMSDIPWAVAWYGQRQSVWLTLKATADASDPGTHEDFIAINDYEKPIVALYLTPRTMDARFFSEWIAAGEMSWCSFILDSLVKKELPPTFPLHKMMRFWLPTRQLVLTDWDRWRKTRDSE